MQKLSDDQVRDLVVDRRAQEDDPLVEQPAVDVKRPLPAGGLLDDHRYEWAHRPRFFRFLGGIPAEGSNRPAPAWAVGLDRVRLSFRASTAVPLPARRSPCPVSTACRAPSPAR